MRIERALTRKLTFASHQNAVPVIRELVIHNDSGDVFTNLALKLSADPSFIAPKTWIIERLGMGDVLHIKDLDIRLSGDYLRNLNEAVPGKINFSLRHDGSELINASDSIVLLACNEWGGGNYMPELLAAFCACNDPAVDKVLKSTSRILQQRGREPAIDGYHSNSRRRVWEIVSAAWSALAGLRLDYALPPASFETSGQKIRLPSQIMDAGRATCLDLAMFAAAVMEQAGFNPIVVFTEGHAFVGVWLQNEQFSTLTVDDAGALRKRIDLQELLVFETVLLTQSRAPRFSVAINKAIDQISVEHEDRFLFATDIRRARMRSIRPLATQVSQSDQGAGNETVQQEVSFEAAPLDLPDADIKVEETLPETPETRLDRWQRKLLDLSLRNRLLNFRAGKKSVEITCHDPGVLEDKLAQKQKIVIKPIPGDLVGNQERSDALHHQRSGEHLLKEYAKQALERNELVSMLDKKELESRLIELYRTARNDLQEGGANTLFLALGFLIWKKSDRSERKFRAPLILIPVSLERKSVRAGIKLLLHDDEPRFNTTLLEMLKQDFHLEIRGLDGDLPEDAHGIDVHGIWRRIKYEVKEIEGMEVIEDMVLGLFSFAKYLMWKDLMDRTRQLKASRIVRHLMETPRDPYPSEIDFPEPSSLDNEYSPKDILAPMPADSSQLSAVLACAKGKDFILIGPPGTGKSQTITNMIAHNLAQGRKVLFVSEKIAALEVVYRRLQAIGLGRFCLELHSRKANKAAVLNQLKAAWDESSTRSTPAWGGLANRLQQQRDKINKLVQRLHHKHNNGWSAYQAIGTVISNMSIPSIDLAWGRPDIHSISDYEDRLNIAHQVDIYAKELKAIFHSPLRSIHGKDWSPKWEKALIDHCMNLMQVTRGLHEQATWLLDKLGLTSPAFDYQQLDTLSELAKLLPSCHGREIVYAADAAASRTIKTMREACNLLLEYRKEEKGLSCRYNKQPWQNMDIDSLQSKWRAAASTWWPKSFFQKRSIIKELKTLGGAEREPDVGADLKILASLESHGRKLEQIHRQIPRIPAWKALDTDIKYMQQEIVLAEKIRALSMRLAQNPESLIEIRTKMKKLLGEGNDLLEQSGPIGQRCCNFSTDWGALREKLGVMAHLAANKDFGQPDQKDAGNWLLNLGHSLSAIIENRTGLKTWCGWRRLCGDAAQLGLEKLVQAVATGDIQPGGAESAFQINYARWWINSVISEDYVLRDFTSLEHEDAIRKFCDLDDEFADMTREHIKALLSMGLSSARAASGGQEFGILKREIEKKRRHMPIRKLITRIPTALIHLKPCLLMSPLSIAQYLPADHAKFDVVIFDEASQITVWDAIGAIARGRQAVIVGDPKQLPPTSFFNRSDEEADEDVDLDSDLESILDEFLGANIPVLKISWHYRSRHESLIAFSNHRYYGGSLITFPSAITKDTSVSFCFVENAIYERGKAQINQVEAKAVVKEITCRLKKQAKSSGRNGPSIGVVTFNSQQQRLIEDLLDAERRQTPEIERFFSEELEEPVFIKNLESVQGDERDIMFFSLTYGPDLAGKMTMNFGPMNKDGGERRLNVAITRARSELIVFSSFRPEAMDLSRTSARGVIDLKHFMEYAERGPRALAEAVHGSLGGYESPFEEAVADRIRSKGWTVQGQIGVSTFRIDLGIVHPDSPGIYLAGVECDGASYHSLATARDRDKIRQQKLNELGWNIIRVWSTDWWYDPEGVTTKLHDELSALLETSRAKARQEQAKQVAKDPDESVAEATRGMTLPPDMTPRGSLFLQTYHLADVAGKFQSQLEPDKFYESSYTGKLLLMITYVVKFEGPIHEDLLVNRIAHAHGFRRAGRLIRDRICKIAQKNFHHSPENGSLFYWPNHTSPIGWSSFRSPQPGEQDSYRPVDKICREELMVLARVLKKSGTSNILEDMKQHIGIGRLTTSVRGILHAISVSVDEVAGKHGATQQTANAQDATEE